MVNGTEEETPETPAPLALDDSDCAIPDDWGLNEAYKSDARVVQHGEKMYIAGSSSFRDLIDDTLIPLHLVRNSQRYQQALEALRDANGRVTYLSGHSLGGAVAAVLQEDALAGRLGPRYRGFREVRTYGAPLLHPDHIPNLRAYRHPYDPISALDAGAALAPTPGWNPHSSKGFNRSNSIVPPITGSSRNSNVYVM